MPKPADCPVCGARVLAKVPALEHWWVSISAGELRYEEMEGSEPLNVCPKQFVCSDPGCRAELVFVNGAFVLASDTGRPSTR